MLLIPAIDLKGGACVRLAQGRMDRATHFSSNPGDMARRWRDVGCRRLHVVDLDAAFSGAPVHHREIAEIVRRAEGIPVQVGGGIRNADTARAYLDSGVDCVIVGTAAVEDFNFLADLAGQFPKQVAFGLDARGDHAATHGWGLTSQRTVPELARAADDLPLAAIIHTDITRDGMLSGINHAATLALAGTVSTPVIASGGLHGLTDLAALREADAEAGQLLLGAISGRALYTGALDFQAGQALLDGIAA